MRKEIKHGPEFVKDTEQIRNHRVTRLLFFAIGVILTVLFFNLKI